MSLILFSIVTIVSSKMVFSLVQKSTNDAYLLENNLVLETTRLFLSKQNDLSKLKQIDTSLYFDDNLLLENISKYKKSTNDKIISIIICIHKDSICQAWKIKR